MTTIAYKNGIVATDSLGTPKGLDVKKVYDLQDGVYMAGTGIYAYIQTVARSLLNDSRSPKEFIDTLYRGLFIKDHYQLPELKDTTLIFFWRENNIVTYAEVFDNYVSLIDDKPFMAWGSGFEYALGAMEAGKSAKQAVEIAIRYDDMTDGKIQSMRI